VTHRLFGEIKDRYLDRQGGYVRIVKKGVRRGDGAPVSIIQLLPPEEGGKKGRKRAKPAAESPPAPKEAPEANAAGSGEAPQENNP
jgi:large subunit ribosomal protein L17